MNTVFVLQMKSIDDNDTYIVGVYDNEADARHYGQLEEQKNSFEYRFEIFEFTINATNNIKRFIL